MLPGFVRLEALDVVVFAGGVVFGVAVVADDCGGEQR
jgi:hypothetical protein